MPVHPDSVLFVTLDSCRYDTFEAAHTPNIRAVGPLHRAQAPGHFTYGSHAAMFVGFTPSVPGCKQLYLDNKYSKMFKLTGGGTGYDNPAFTLEGEDIVSAFRARGYACFGSGAVGWFDPATPCGRALTRPFDEFHYGGIDLPGQLAFLEGRIAAAGARPMFAFLNIGETHVPYWHAGAPWDAADNPCIPYAATNRADVCRMRQKACCEYVDEQLGPLLERFSAATIVFCADHGDCWGEDGLWEHGVSHPMTLTVPLILRLRGRPVAMEG